MSNIGCLEIPSISYKSSLARTSFTVAAIISDPALIGVEDVEGSGDEDDDDDDDDDCDCDEDDGISEPVTQEIGFG